MTTDICVCPNHNHTLSPVMTYYRICNKSNTTGTTSEAGTAYPSGSTWVHSQFLVDFVQLNLLIMVYWFVDHCLPYGHCIVCPSSNYGFSLPLWNLQTILAYTGMLIRHMQGFQYFLPVLPCLVTVEKFSWICYTTFFKIRRYQRPF